ncbi:GWxTD domain-containing protein [Arsenicibacter rosenii]|uniref:GWxTD domain-containing protein n=1 Tax=Arsenicibacter rosenii TaxID=1750698 RepID=A0A1S2VAS3_9BACT|nr:GWxTD domain-containing protein [Arsenicibacter rosenii]OIN55824.1 GWxTD domain-containing protein [Arsenicibacter rosenii]
MRFYIFLSLILLGAACKSGKTAQQTQANTPGQTLGSNTRTSSRPSGGSASDSRPLARPSSVLPNSTSAPAPAPPADWAVTSIKGKFLIIDSTSIRVYLNLTGLKPDGSPIKNADDLAAHFLVNYVIYPDYNSRDRLGYGNVPITSQVVVPNGEYLTLMFDVKRPSGAINGILLTEITETNNGKKALNDLPVRFRSTKLSDRYALFDKDGKLPLLRNYVNLKDTVVIRDVNGTVKPLYTFRYRHDFEAASSPMNTTTRPAPKTLTVDSSLVINTSQPFRMPSEGLYFFLEDSTETYGVGLVVADNRFPKLTRPEKLVKPVLYMSTSTEINELNNTKEVKKAFDRYWLNLMSGNEDIARRAIRAYFNRVEDANRLFTTYKEGWKTDKGMIYVVLGPPDRVQRSRDREVWVYNRRANVSEINFTFNRKPNQFVEDHYELVRYMEYQPIWYPIVEAWRTGAIRE